MQPKKNIKLVVVGDGTVGKTCMLMSYSTNVFPDDYIPTIFDNYAVTLPIGATNYTLQLFDTAGQEDFDKLRILSYSQTDIFLVCFSVENSDSFENVKLKWIPEICKHSPKTPILIVGTKIDLRTVDSNETGSRRNTCLSLAQGQQLAKKLKAVSYVECSALTKVGLKSVFEKALLEALCRKKRKRRCAVS